MANRTEYKRNGAYWNFSRLGIYVNQSYISILEQAGIAAFQSFWRKDVFFSIRTVCLHQDFLGAKNSAMGGRR